MNSIVREALEKIADRSCTPYSKPYEALLDCHDLACAALSSFYSAAPTNP